MEGWWADSRSHKVTKPFSLPQVLSWGDQKHYPRQSVNIDSPE